RFTEFLDLTDRLLREPAVSYAGRYYSAVEARTHPGCVQPPRMPFAVAAAGPRRMRLAATSAAPRVTTGQRAHQEVAAELAADGYNVGDRLINLLTTSDEENDPAVMLTLVADVSSLGAARLTTGLMKVVIVPAGCRRPTRGFRSAPLSGRRRGTRAERPR